MKYTSETIVMPFVKTVFWRTAFNYRFWFTQAMRCQCAIEL